MGFTFPLLNVTLFPSNPFCASLVIFPSTLNIYLRKIKILNLNGELGKNELCNIDVEEKDSVIHKRLRSPGIHKFKYFMPVLNSNQFRKVWL